MKEFEKNPKCGKCGWETTEILFIPRRDIYYSHNDFIPEHLKITCGRCKHSWNSEVIPNTNHQHSSPASEK